MPCGQAPPPPTADILGHKVDLPGALRARMESSFGADLSGLQLYESQAVADAGAEAITQGSRIAFAPGKLDFASTGGQALLGHEISHAVSQARGEVTGNGFLQSHALEARADREGMLAAMGQPISAAPVGAISDVSAASAAGPMQAKKKKDETPVISNPTLVSSTNPLANPTAAAPVAAGATPLQQLKANQTAYIPSLEKDTAHQQAYNALSMRNTKENPNKISKELDSALAVYVATCSTMNGQLRAGKTPEQMVEEGAAKRQLDLVDAGKNIQAIDQHMQDHGTLEEDLTTYRGVDDRFLEYLFQQAGIKSKKYLDKDGKLSHDKVMKNGLLDKLVGMTYEDKGYVSTTTNPAFADTWAMNNSVSNWKRENQYNPSQHSPEQQVKIEQALLHAPELMKGSHMMVMNSHQGTKGEFISKPGSSQNEFMLNRGQGYQITGINPRAEGSYEFQIEVLGALEEALRR